MQMDNFNNFESEVGSVSYQTANADVIEAPHFAESRSSGRVARDERGNSVWEWQTQPGVYSRDISKQELTRLEAKHLALVDATPLRTFFGGWIYQSER
jgi:hypothetical protein